MSKISKIFPRITHGPSLGCLQCALKVTVNLTNTCLKMFRDSKIANNFHRSRTKTTCILNKSLTLCWRNICVTFFNKYLYLNEFWNITGISDAWFGFLPASRLLLFSIKCCKKMLSFNCDRSHWKVKIVFLNFQNIREGNFNLAKSLRNTYNGVYFLSKKELLQRYFSKYSHSLWKIMPCISKRHLLLAVSP